MGKYIKLFEKHSDYEAFVNSGLLIKPNVSYCLDVDDVHYNPIVVPQPLKITKINNLDVPYFTDYGGEFWGEGPEFERSLIITMENPVIADSAQVIIHEGYFENFQSFSNHGEWIDEDELPITASATSNDNTNWNCVVNITRYYTSYKIVILFTKDSQTFEYETYYVWDGK